MNTTTEATQGADWQAVAIRLKSNRDLLNEKLRQVTAQRDELLAASRAFAQFVDAKKPIVHNTQITTLDKAGSEYCEFTAAISKAEQ